MKIRKQEIQESGNSGFKNFSSNQEVQGSGNSGISRKFRRKQEIQHA
jgi:hypothetical protein